MSSQHVAPKSLVDRWRQMARQIEKEPDPKKVIYLAQQLVEEMDRDAESRTARN